MTTTPDALPDDARLWIFPLSRAVALNEAHALRERMHPFLQTWTSHGRPVEAALMVAEDAFVVVAAQIPGGDVSGCGIDALVRHLEGVLAGVGVPLASGMDVAFRGSDGQIQIESRPAFKRRVAGGAVAEDTRVFDASITSLGAWRSGAFERRLADTWMARYLATPTS